MADLAKHSAVAGYRLRDHEILVTENHGGTPQAFHELAHAYANQVVGDHYYREHFPDDTDEVYASAIVAIVRWSQNFRNIERVLNHTSDVPVTWQFPKTLLDAWWDNWWRSIEGAFGGRGRNPMAGYFGENGRREFNMDDVRPVQGWFGIKLNCQALSLAYARMLSKLMRDDLVYALPVCGSRFSCDEVNWRFGGKK